MVKMSPGTAGTLSVQGIAWTYLKHNGKVAFECGKHAIHFVPQTNLYHVKEKGDTVFVSGSVSECLEEATPIVLDYHASKLTPSWES